MKKGVTLKLLKHIVK